MFLRVPDHDVSGWWHSERKKHRGADVWGSRENVHSEVYSLLIETYIRDSEERSKLFRAVQTSECEDQARKDSKLT